MNKQFINAKNDQNRRQIYMTILLLSNDITDYNKIQILNDLHKLNSKNEIKNKYYKSLLIFAYFPQSSEYFPSFHYFLYAIMGNEKQRDVSELLNCKWSLPSSSDDVV